MDESAGTDILGDDRSQGAGGIVAGSGLGKTATEVKFALSKVSFQSLPHVACDRP